MRDIISELIFIIDSNATRYESECEDFHGYALDAIIGNQFQTETPILSSVLKENKEKNLKMTKTEIIDKSLAVFADEYGFELKK